MDRGEVDEILEWAWVCDRCNIKSLGAGPMKCWICGKPMFQATLRDFKMAKGSYISPRREAIIRGEELYPLDWFWICWGCDTTVISSVQPQCWPCREMMKNMTLHEFKMKAKDLNP